MFCVIGVTKNLFEAGGISFVISTLILILANSTHFAWSSSPKQISKQKQWKSYFGSVQRISVCNNRVLRILSCYLEYENSWVLINIAYWPSPVGICIVSNICSVAFSSKYPKLGCRTQKLKADLLHELSGGTMRLKDSVWQDPRPEKQTAWLAYLTLQGHWIKFQQLVSSESTLTHANQDLRERWNRLRFSKGILIVLFVCASWKEGQWQQEVNILTGWSDWWQFLGKKWKKETSYQWDQSHTVQFVEKA